MVLRLRVCLSVGMLMLCGFANPIVINRGTTTLFNGTNLDGWDTYIGPAFDSVHNKFEGSAEGLNRDSRGVFQVVSEDGRPAIRVSGERFA